MRKAMAALVLLIPLWASAADIKMAVTEHTLTMTGGDDTGQFQVTIGSLGWTPKAVLVILTSGLTDGTAAATFRMSVGAADAGAEWAISMVDYDAQTTTNTARSDYESGGTAAVAILADQGTVFMRIVGAGDGSGTCGSGGNVGPNADGWCFNLAAEATSISRNMKVIFFGGDDLTADVNVSQALTGTSAITVTTGVECDLLFLGTVGAAFPSATSSFGIFGFGVIDRAINQQWMAVSSDDNVGTSTAFSYTGTGAGIGQISDASASVVWDATVGNFQSTSFDLTPSASPLGDKVGFLCLNVDTGDAWADAIAMPTTSASAWTVTTPNFLPVGVGFLMNATATANDNSVVSDSTAGAFAMGVFDGTREIANGASTEDAQTTTDTQSLSHDIALHYADGPGAVLYDQDTDGSFALTATGWSLTWGTTPVVSGTARTMFAWAIGANITAGGSIIPILLNQARRRR